MNRYCFLGSENLSFCWRLCIQALLQISPPQMFDSERLVWDFCQLEKKSPILVDLSSMLKMMTILMMMLILMLMLIAEVWSWFSKVWPRFWSSSLVKIVGSPFWSTSAIPSPTSLYLQKSYAPRLSHWKFSFNQNLSFLNRTPFGQGNSSWIDQVINKLSAFQRRSTVWLVEPVHPSRGLSIQRNGNKI